MTGYIDDDVFDLGLSACGASITHVWIVSTANTTVPISYGSANTNKCGVKPSPSCTYAIDATSGTAGRKIKINAISTGATITDNTVAKYWAAVSTTNSKLFACQKLTATQAVSSGNPFTLDAVNITIRHPTS